MLVVPVVLVVRVDVYGCVASERLCLSCLLRLLYALSFADAMQASPGDDNCG